MAPDDDSAAWRASARAFGVVRAAVAVRVVGLVGAIVELWFADHRDAMRITVLALAAMVVSDVVAAAGAARLARRAPAGRRGARTAVAGLIACAAFDTWALAWLTDAVSSAGPLLVCGMALGALTGALGVLAAAISAVRAIGRPDLLPRLQRASSLLAVGTVIEELGIAIHDDLGFLLMLPAFALLLVGAIAYLLALGRVRAAILDHAPAPPRATASIHGVDLILRCPRLGNPEKLQTVERA